MKALRVIGISVSVIGYTMFLVAIVFSFIYPKTAIHSELGFIVSVLFYGSIVPVSIGLFALYLADE